MTKANRLYSKVNFLKATFIILVVTQITWYVLLYCQILAHPMVGETDFISNYTAGKIAQTDPSLIYNLELQRKIQIELVAKNWIAGDVLPFIHPPYLVPILGYVVNEDYVGSFIQCEIILIILEMISLLVIFLLFRTMGFNIRTAIVMAASFTLFYPLVISLIKGQDSVLLLLGTLLWIFAVVKNQDRIAGFALALTTIRPHISLVLALPFVWKHKKIGFWFCIGCCVMGLYSFSLIGIQGLKDFYQMIKLSANGTAYGLNQSSMFNLLGLLLRIFPDMDTSLIKTLSWAVYFVAIIFISFLWYKSKGNKIRLIGTVVILSVITVPHFHYHDLTLLIIPLLSIAIQIGQKEQESIFGAGVFGVLISSFFLLIVDLTSLRFYGPYILLIIFGIFLWHPEIAWFSTVGLRQGLLSFFTRIFTRPDRVGTGHKT